MESLTSVFEGDDDTVEVTEDGRASSAPVSFTLRVDPANEGVRLRRMSDQANAYQTARVLVDGQDVGTWLQPLGNEHQRWLHDTFELPPSATVNKRELRIELVPVAGAPAWHAARYVALSYVRPFSDHEPPSRVVGLSATGGESNAIRLSWKPADDDVGIDYYEVYGSREPGDAIGPETLLGTTTSEGFVHEVPGLRETWYYRVRAVDTSGNTGPVSEEASGTSGSTLRVEAESLLPATSSTDDAVPQENTRWSGGAQIWFQSGRDGANGVGDNFTVELDVPQDGTYDLAAVHTKARDYGIHTLAVDGRVVGEPFDGYSPTLIADARHEYGAVTLSRGTHTVTFTVTGKNPANTTTRYYVGVDVIELELQG